MPSPLELYPLVVVWLQAVGVTTHPTAVVARADLVTALLVQLALLPGALRRALLSPMHVAAVWALRRRVPAAWPAGAGPHLLADRAFPSHPLSQTLRTVGWGWTIRLRATSWVTVRGEAQGARALLAGARVGVWTGYAGTYG